MNPAKIDPFLLMVWEHEVIKLVLDCLEHSINSAISTGECDSGIVKQAAEFLRGFADQLHHAKEEDLLFPMLLSLGNKDVAGLIECLSDEHILGRKKVSGMLEFVDKRDSFADRSVKDLSENATSFVGMLRSHIQKEDTILFPIAEKHLSDNDRRKLGSRFRELDWDEGEDYRWHSFIGSAKSLVRYCGIDADDDQIDWFLKSTSTS